MSVKLRKWCSTGGEESRSLASGPDRDADAGTTAGASAGIFHAAGVSVDSPIRAAASELNAKKRSTLRFRLLGRGDRVARGVEESAWLGMYWSGLIWSGMFWSGMISRSHETQFSAAGFLLAVAPPEGISAVASSVWSSSIVIRSCLRARLSRLRTVPMDNSKISEISS